MKKLAILLVFVSCFMFTACISSYERKPCYKYCELLMRWLDHCGQPKIFDTPLDCWNVLPSSAEPRCIRLVLEWEREVDCASIPEIPD